MISREVLLKIVRLLPMMTGVIGLSVAGCLPSKGGDERVKQHGDEKQATSGINLDTANFIGLPEGKWSKAISDLNQSQCLDPTLNAKPSVVLSANNTGVTVDAKSLRFRCDQKVTYSARVDDGSVHVVFHPQEMNPREVSRCDCSYNFSTNVPLVTGRKYLVSVYRQGDNYGGASKPELISSGNISVGGSSNQGGSEVGIGQGGAPNTEESTELAVKQSACQMDKVGSSPVVTVQSPSSQTISIDVKNLSFRCDQAVLATLTNSAEASVVTFHPKEMNPKTVAKCDCPYDLSTTFPASAGSKVLVKIFRQADNNPSPSSPVSIAVKEVIVK